MRASTVRCRFSDRCGDRVGVESAFKDSILAAVLNSRCRCKFGPYLRASLRGAVMCLFRDRRDRRDLSLKVCWTLAVWLMTQQLRCDVNEADEAEQRRLERHPSLFLSFSSFLLNYAIFIKLYPSMEYRER